MPHEYDGTRRDLVLYRIETAKEDLDAAKLLLAGKAYKSANNRAYYAIFHSVNAVHALDGRAYKRHKGNDGTVLGGRSRMLL